MSSFREISVTGFSDVEIAKAESLMRTLDPARFDGIDYFGLETSHRIYGTEFDGGKIRKCHFESCTFSDVSFVGAAGSACSFKRCMLQNCNIKDTCFDFSDFSGTSISADKKGNNIQSSGFSHSDFSDASISNIEFRGCNFDSSRVSKARVSNALFKFCNFENANFNGTLISNTDLSNASMDFSIMRNVAFDNVKISMISLLHSFYGLQSAERFPSGVTVGFPSSEVEIGFPEFIDKLPAMQAFLFRINDFFSLSTAEIFFGNHDTAYSYIWAGLAHSVKHRDFRMIGYYCKLASFNHFFTRAQLRQIYDGLKSDHLIQEMTSHEYDTYTYELDRIRRILVDRPFGLPQVNISITTSIDQDDIDGAARLTAHLNHLLQSYLPESNNALTMRHNSPFQFEIILSDDIVNLYNCAILISTSIFGLTSAIKRIQKLIYEHHRISGLKLDNEKKKIEIEMAQIDANLKKERFATAGRGTTLISANGPQCLPAGLVDQIGAVRLTVSADVKVDPRIRELTFTR